MQRDSEALQQYFDVLIVGAGICGATLARLAAHSGLRVALIDRGDFGGATSRNSAKIVHGGLRYLQHFDVRRVRDSVAAQRAWLAAAPHLVRPLRCVVPTYGRGTRGRAALRAGLFAYQFLAHDRNRGLRPADRLPAGQTIGRSALLARYPFFERPDVSGGAVWYDAQMQDAGRLTLECVMDAHRCGAAVANHVQAVELLRARRGVRGIVARDVLSGRELEIRARCTVNATGPWLERTLDSLPRALRGWRTIAWTRNLNLVTRRLFPGEEALAVASRQPSDAAIGRSERLYFIVPWQDCSIVGTAHGPYRGDPDDIRPEPEEIEHFVAEIDTALPDAGLRPEDVRYVHIGLTPAEEAHSGRARRSVCVDHLRTDDLEGLISVAAVKFTTAPVVASALVRLLLARLGATGRRPASFETPFTAALGHGGVQSTRGTVVATAGRGELERAMQVYGTCFGPMMRSLPVAETEAEAERVFRSRIAYGVRNEMVMTLADALLRATDHAERGVLTEAQLQWCARYLAAAQGWPEERRRVEIERFRTHIARRALARPTVRRPSYATLQPDTGMAT